MNTKRIKELEDQLLLQSKNYYNGIESKTNIDDQEYDKLVEELRKIDPDNKYFTKIGIKEINNNKLKEIPHNPPMMSADKVKGNNFENVVKWCKNVLSIIGKYKIDWYIEPKLDGNSIELKYVKGILESASSRGDGKIGLEIPIERLNNIPLTIKNSNIELYIRGEAIISKKYKLKGKIDKNTPLRNLCAGILKRKEFDKTKDNFIDFIAYQIEPFNKYRNDSEVIKKLREYGFRTVPLYTFNNFKSIEYFYDKYLKELRDKYEYESDGLMLIVSDTNDKIVLDRSKLLNHHHHYNIAIKPSEEQEWTRIINVEWKVGKTRKITPTGILEPVKIGDAIYERVTLNNIKTIKDMNLCIGDKVLIRRSNDVIPTLVKNEYDTNDKNRNIIDIKTCPSCGSKIVLDKSKTNYYCENINCLGQTLSIWLNWFKCCNIKNLSEKMLIKFLEYTKFQDLWRIYAISDILCETIFSNALKVNMNTPNMKEFMSSFKQSRYITELQMIAYYGIPGIGIKTLNKYNINNYKDLLKYKKFNNNYSEAEKRICEFLNEGDNLDNLNRLYESLKPTFTSSNNKKKDINTIKFCISGEFDKSRKDIIKEIEDLLNWKYENTVTKDLNVLITTTNNNSSKVKLAKKLNKTIFITDNDINYDNLKMLSYHK
jgi:DNA ligase (NAD+)